MNFFSGFSLEGEAKLFEAYAKEGIYCVSGFSLGAIKACEYVLQSSRRVDTLQLFSPAFFQNKSDKFKRLQTISYQKNQAAYEETFLKNIAYPSVVDMQVYFKQDTVDSLEILLHFIWDEAVLQSLVKKGVLIEVYLGGKDKIIDAKAAYDFFKPYCTVYFIKEGGHILHG